MKRCKDCNWSITGIEGRYCAKTLMDINWLEYYLGYDCPVFDLIDRLKK